MGGSSTRCDFCYIMEVYDHKTLMYDYVEDYNMFQIISNHFFETGWIILILQ